MLSRRRCILKRQVPFCFAFGVDNNLFKTRLSRGSRLGYQACGGGHVAAVIDAETAVANDTHIIALRPQLGEIRGFLMTHRKLSAPISSARRIAVSAVAATLLSAPGFSVDTALAQQPPPTAPRPAAPKPATPAAPKPAAPAAQKPPAAGPAPQAAAPGAAPEMPQLIYSPWAKFCGKGNDAGAKEVCFTGKDARTEAGQPVVAAALIEPEGEPKKLFRVTLPSPLQLQYGTRIIIDKEPAISGAFFTCFANGCMADYEATPELVGKLKKGQMLQIQAINLAAAAITFPLPLADNSGNSFQKANEGPPTDPKVFEEQQKKLQEDLQKRADELRKKLESQGGAPPK
jgi:invasion protein IalB